jgi:hypothetical protein
MLHRCALEAINLLVRNLIRNVLASRLLEHVSGAVGLPHLISPMPQIKPLDQTHNLLVDATVLLGVLAHGATELLLNGVEALVRVVLVARGVLGGV